MPADRNDPAAAMRAVVHAMILAVAMLPVARGAV
jgi:hypothetical protein